ncbi:MAG: chitobiase/beta-hexosaminidase C-terminal domain-containing protein [Chitinivibrionales bacterium]|nr:chitobiase/beta-hexosaminidase C-terminal domain-containing protein [Chitinivibrionales bacterium]
MLKVSFKQLLSLIIIGFSASLAQSAPPPLAAAAGYTVNTFSSTFDIAQVDLNNTVNPGYNWYLSRFMGFGVTDSKGVMLNGDGSVSLENNGGVNTGILTAGLDVNASSWVGTVFGGGGYFEAILKFDPASLSGNGWPSWWSYPIEHMAGVAQWPGQEAGFEHFVEPDFFEYDVAGSGKNCYGGAFHEFGGHWNPVDGYPLQWDQPSSKFIIAAPGIDGTGAGYKQYHKVSFLWIPATAGVKGHAYFCFDDQKTYDSLSWSLYTNQPPPANLTKPIPTTSWTFGVIDSQHFALILGQGSAGPMTIQSVNVWQKTGYFNGLDGTLPNPSPDQNLPLITPIGGEVRIDSTLVSMMTLASSGVTIRYTLDGSVPTGTSAAYTGPFVLRQSAVLKACGFAASGNSAVATQTYKIISRVAKPSSSGLLYNYYEYDGAPWISVKNKNWAQYTVKSSGTTDSFSLGMIQRNYKIAVRYYGTISIPTAGVYTFSVNSDAGANLFMGDYLVAANDGTHSVTTGASGDVRLQPGCYPISVDYYMDSTIYGTSGNLKPALNVYYKGPGITKTLIPKSVLFNNNVAVKWPLTAGALPGNSLTIAINKGNMLVSVALPGPHQLEIVRLNGATALRLSGQNAAVYSIKRRSLPAGIYTLRATNAAGQKIIKYVPWY